MEKFNRLLGVMKRSLVDIDLAINGFIVMGEVLDEMYLRFTNNQVPKNWAKVGYLSRKPLSSWFKDLIERVHFMDNWLKYGNPPVLTLQDLYVWSRPKSKSRNPK